MGPASQSGDPSMLWVILEKNDCLGKIPPISAAHDGENWKAREKASKQAG